MPLKFNFLGNCHNLALALHGLTGLPLCLLYGERDLEIENPENGKMEIKTEKILIHAGIIWNGCFYDEYGNQGDPAELMREFREHNPDYALTKIIETDAPTGEFYEVLNKTGAVVNSELIEKFKELILNLKSRFPFLD